MFSSSKVKANGAQIGALRSAVPLSHFHDVLRVAGLVAKWLSVFNGFTQSA